MKRSATALAAAMVIAACASSTPKKAEPPPVPTQAMRYSSESGPSPVGVIPAALLHDGQRNRDLSIDIEYPTRGVGPFPLIIFSHGYGGASSGYEGLAAYWASYGYIVARPSHADAGALRDQFRERLEERRKERQDQQKQGRAGNRQMQREERDRAEAAAQAAEAVWKDQREPQWRDRLRDVTFIIDSLDELERHYPELQGKIDHNKIGVGGHSYGAFTAMLVAGAKTSGDQSVGAYDPRVRAIVAMSPQGIGGPQNLTAESWRNVKIPAMFITGSRDVGAEGETPDWRRGAFENSPAGDKYLVFIEGARHMSFAGVAPPIQAGEVTTRDFPDYPTGQRPPDPYGGRDSTSFQTDTRERPWAGGDRYVFNASRMAALTFWDAYLKDEAKAKDSLKSNIQMFRATTVTRK
jgi:predicted dienelactone hydrolase